MENTQSINEHTLLSNALTAISNSFKTLLEVSYAQNQDSFTTRSLDFKQYYNEISAYVEFKKQELCAYLDNKLNEYDNNVFVGYMLKSAHAADISSLEDKYVTISSEQTIAGKKSFYPTANDSTTSFNEIKCDNAIASTTMITNAAVKIETNANCGKATTDNMIIKTSAMQITNKLNAADLSVANDTEALTVSATGNISALNSLVKGNSLKTNEICCDTATYIAYNGNISTTKLSSYKFVANSSNCNTLSCENYVNDDQAQQYYLTIHALDGIIKIPSMELTNLKNNNLVCTNECTLKPSGNIKVNSIEADILSASLINDKKLYVDEKCDINAICQIDGKKSKDSYIVGFNYLSSKYIETLSFAAYNNISVDAYVDEEGAEATHYIEINQLKCKTISLDDLEAKNLNCNGNLNVATTTGGMLENSRVNVNTILTLGLKCDTNVALLTAVATRYN